MAARSPSGFLIASRSAAARILINDLSRQIDPRTKLDFFEGDETRQMIQDRVVAEYEKIAGEAVKTRL